MRPFQTSLLVGSLLISTATAVAQDAGGDSAPPAEQTESTQPTPEQKEAAAAELRAAVWTLQARAAASKASIPADASAKVVEAFVAVRTRHHRTIETLREQRREEQREQGAGDPTLMELYELQRSIHVVDQRERTALAQSLVELLDRPAAERVYPLLAAFDTRTDSLTALVVELKLEDQPSLDAVGAVEQYFIDITGAASLARVDRAAWSEARKRARDTLLNAVRPLLTEEQMILFEKRLGATGDPNERPSRRGRQS